MSSTNSKTANFIAEYQAIGAPSIVIVVVLLTSLAGAYWYSDNENGISKAHIIFPVIMSGVISATMAVLPIIVATVQTTLQQRQIKKLNSVGNPAIKNTHYFQIALSNLVSIRPVAIGDKDYKLPLITLAFVTMFLSLISFSGLIFNIYFMLPSPILGGLHTLQNDVTFGDMILYQKSTFTAMAFGFQGAYVYMMFRLLDRVNTNDIYPISFYFYAVRMVIACMVAGVLRHVAELLHLDKPYLIALMGFMCGLSPDLLLTSIARRGFALAKILGVQGDPDKKFVPTNSNLLMIKGLDRSKADRLIEMGIENAQVLSCQNPLTLWTRLPFELRLIVDWISQAQLYKYVGETGLEKLRENGVQNAGNLIRAKGDEKGAEEIGKALAIPEPLIAILLDNVANDPSVKRLAEVSAAL